MAGLKVKGVEQAIRGLRKFQRELENELFDGVLEAARPVASEMRGRVKKTYGHIRRSIKAGRLKRRLGRNIAAYVRVDRRIAPDAHWLEFGTGPRYTDDGKFTGSIKASPYFRSVADEVNSGTFAPVTVAGKRAVAKFKP